MKSLEGHNVVVTGGSLGIGLVVAKRCAIDGARVVIAARNKEDLSRALDDLKTTSPLSHASYSVDVGEVDQVGRFADWCRSECGEIHGLVNCAGICGPIGKTTSVSMNEFTKAIRINFLGTVYMCHAFTRIFSHTKRKKIVNFSGGGAATPRPNYSAYAASKAAIVRFTENLALELASENVDVNCIAPGFVITRLHQQTLQAGEQATSKEFLETTRKQIESGGVSPEKAAELTVFLLSEESNGITGKLISAPWDPWKEQDFQTQLKTDKDLATLRRIDNTSFLKKS